MGISMFSVLLFCLMTVVASTGDGGTFVECDGHVNEVPCYGSQEYCYYKWQRCDGIPDCPYYELADECLCKMYCDSMKGYRYCEDTDTCVSWGEMCPMGATIVPPTVVCPEFAPYSCWRMSDNLKFTTTSLTCYSKKEKCNGVRDCAGGEDEEDCESSSKNTLIYTAFAVGVFAILVPVTVFFLIRRWRRNRRLREEANDNNSVDVDVTVRVHVSRRSYGDTSNPVFGLPPPCYPDETNGQMEIRGEFPPPYVEFKPPSNEGPKSVLPTYSEAMSSKTDANQPNET